MQLFFRKLGSGPPLIILHGLFGSADNWLSMAKMLSTHFEVYAIDLRNHGQSPHVEQHTYHDIANDLQLFMSDHALEKPYCVGHSMGGKALMQVINHLPDIFKRSVVVDIAPKAYPPHHQSYLQGLKAIPLETLVSRQMADDILKMYVPTTEERQFLLKNLYRDAEGNFRWRMHLEALSQQIHHIYVETLPTKKIMSEVLFIKGANSDYITERDILEITHWYPKSSIVTLENAGHWVHVDQPDRFRDIILNFFQ